MEEECGNLWVFHLEELFILCGLLVMVMLVSKNLLYKRTFQIPMIVKNCNKTLSKVIDAVKTVTKDTINDAAK